MKNSNLYPNLQKWINPEYVEEFMQGTLHLRKINWPFSHAVLENFFNPLSLESILEHTKKIPVTVTHRQGLAEKSDWYWGAYSNLDFIRFFLGQEMREFLNTLVDIPLVIKRKAIPQYNVFHPRSAGIPVHNDFCEEVGAVSLLQLSQGYEEGRGGELVFYRREEERLIPEKVISPEFNKFMIFEVSDRSYHGVTDMNGDWTRRTIVYDWLNKSNLHYNTHHVS